MNSFQVTGNLGADPSITKFENGNQVARFSIANNRRFKTHSGEVRESTDWFQVSVYSTSRIFHAATQLKKGDSVLVQGSATQTTTEKDGIKTTYHGVRAASLYKLDWSIFKNNPDDIETEDDSENVPF